MYESDDIKVMHCFGTDVKNRYLKSYEHLYAMDTGAHYVCDKNGNPQAIVTASTNSSGGVEESFGGQRIFARGEKQWLLKPTAVGLWDATGSPVGAAAESVVDGVYSLKKNTGSNIARYHPIAPRLLPDTIALYIDCDDWSKVGSFTVRLLDSGKANGWSWLNKLDYTSTGSAYWYGSGRRVFTLSINDNFQAIGTPDAATTLLSNFYLRVDGKMTGDQPTIALSGVEINPTPSTGRGSIVIGADDAIASWYSDGLPVLEAYGLKSYIAVIADKIGRPGFMTLEQLKDAVSRGHQCVIHGPLDYDNGANMRKYTTYAGAYADIKTHLDYVVNNGLARDGSEKVYVYPQGVEDLATGDSTLNQVLRDLGFVAARGTRIAAYPKYYSYCRERLDQCMAFDIPTIGHLWSSGDEAGNITNITTAINSIAAQRRDAMLVFHEVKATPTAQTHISPSNLGLLCKAVATGIALGQLDNLTITQQLNRCIRTPVPLRGI